MLNAQFRPLVQWPGERTKSRKEAAFKVKYERTLDDLEYELTKLLARDIIIQVDNLSLVDIRNDGWPRGGWQPRGGNQGVIVSFDSPKGSMSFPCDRYTEWRDNLRAIALGLEALRAVDRYGVTRGNEQYRGWSRLEAPGANGIVKMDRDTAMQFIASLVGAHIDQLRLNWETIGAGMILRAKKLNHPDHGTSELDKRARHDTFVKIGEAERVLGL